MDLKEIRKVHVDRDDKGIVECPYCLSSRIVDATRFRNREVKVRCICRKTFSVSFEWRGSFRKEVYFDGYYSKLSARKEWHRMLVKNISETGIGLTTPTDNLREGDKVKVKFMKGDTKTSEIEKTAIVRRVAKDNYVGCEFVSSV